MKQKFYVKPDLAEPGAEPVNQAPRGLSEEIKKRVESLAALTPIKHKLSGVEKCYKINLRYGWFLACLSGAEK
ncbi:hypothetical protein [Kosakonia sp. MUSA4]|uniref:hypothetical protein n=1 Tax=Kosakonia sp. MUSA4 TaxID=2067958 RepID=UPI001ABF2332|nr:hypothetical protein [Kosakonia sp. MUSA4]